MNIFKNHQLVQNHRHGQTDYSSINGIVPDQFDWFWPVLWVETMFLIILVALQFFGIMKVFDIKFIKNEKQSPVWPTTWPEPITPIKTDQTGQEQSHWLKNNPFDHCDGFGPVYDYWSCSKGSWPVRSVLIGVMGSCQVVGHTGDCSIFLINLIFFSLCRWIWSKTFKISKNQRSNQYDQ